MRTQKNVVREKEYKKTAILNPAACKCEAAPPVPL